MLETLFGLALEDEQIALCMVVVLFLCLLLGYPVALTLGGVGILFAYLGPDPEILRLLPQRVWGVMGNATLLAVPLFVTMGMLLEKSGLAEKLLTSLSTLFGTKRAGLAIAVVLAGAMLAASTGIVGASVVTMGLISLPLMLRAGYKPSFSGGLICASGTLGQIIPPSIVLILLGDIVGVSVGELFVAAVVPGVLLVIAYCLYAVWATKGVELNFEELVLSNQSKDGNELQEAAAIGFWQLMKVLLPPGILIVSVLGSIFAGIATPTEAAAVGALGALLLSICYRRFSFSMLSEVAEQTLHLTSMVFLILLGAQAFGLVFRGLSGDDAIREFVLSLDAGPYEFLAIVMLLLFILGCFLDFIEIVFIVVPILVPLVAVYEFNMLWISILIALNLQMSFLTPPFGFSLFYLKGVAPDELSTSALYRGVVPLVLIQALVLFAVVMFPALATWLPGVVQ